MSEQADDSPRERGHPPPAGPSSDAPGSQQVGGESSNRLLRAIEELRALERERRAAAATTDRPLHELDRRVERKAREVFLIAEGDDELDPPGGQS